MNCIRSFLYSISYMSVYPLTQLLEFHRESRKYQKIFVFKIIHRDGKVRKKETERTKQKCGKFEEEKKDEDRIFADDIGERR